MLKQKIADYGILSSISLIHDHINSVFGSEICNSSGKTVEKVKLCFFEETGAGFNKMRFFLQKIISLQSINPKDQFNYITAEKMKLMIICNNLRFFVSA